MQYLHGNKDGKKGKRKALMDLLLELHFENQELSEEDICEEVNTFVSAGHETVSLTITWALYLIGLYPDVQAKIHEELDRIFGTDAEREVTESDLNDLKYLNCVLKVFSSFNLLSAKETLAPTIVYCHSAILLTNYRKEVKLKNSVKIPEYGYIPFSAGPRNCIGQKFAIMEMKTIVSSILRNYTIESLDSRDKVLPQIQVTLHPSTPIRVRIRPRRI
ncbi:cytochrome P450 4c3 [Nephila pilipes]|uniref:Cytochrome P450 4c3 n=1 Tax=Nephila pilipes TaxID=299642 RepID=A0A8X6NJ16_NEPPI|nr:cytochrome P450 4c3 [Nephila pilipes]